MDLKTLKTFQLIVKYGSFNRAADEMNYVQSTVTMQIQKLESELGVQLIERGKKIRLTEAGKLFYEQSLQIVKNVDQLQTNLSDLQLGERGNIRLGVTEPTASYRLPVILERFLSQFPKIRISVEFGNTPTLSERLLKGDIDLALCSAPDLGSELYFEPLFREKFEVLMPENHPLAQKAVIAPEDICGHRLLITSATCPYRRKLEMVLQESGNIPIDTMEIGSMTALKHYVESGLGIALVPEIILKPMPLGTTTRPMSGSLIDMPFGILSKPAEYPLKLASSKLYPFLKQELLEHVPN
ncbi:LysR family transcriptional regulator [Paenibacillus alginolyticus]|uniref:LysR family transcriptional regulator n=1 Tax=Paenibacillus alginolyticus TaxID=59839 RepID=A0ABT4GI57_9BACL|nr:LysR family transcriptional regulator [Paenibacillus alginolyticus]MCY9695878.1 LysR family transcriptional regulator [Paenibacillus alginolyticus]MEC0141753.1 LysR family transcriptional regulator [Paenibacillus alginolyticus]